ncbi:aminotransferase class V-fold PLP-dependent enzyme [Halovenus rubra]|uniref:Aminotransferase class V-fold PLP-dependent enzyme n=2 Tax=Halovenus rubra TaxID=869890 RepID=A0ACC7E1Q8_9EURY
MARKESDEPAQPTTLSELRAVTPALSDGHYFNFGAHGPSPRPVVEAAEAAHHAHEYEAPIHDDPYGMAGHEAEKTQERIAAFVGASPDEIALTESTTASVNAIAGAIDWGPGDVVVRTDIEHPAGILPWRRLKRNGVEVRVVETKRGRLDREAYIEAVSDAKLVCFSALTWTHGTVLPVRELVDIAHDAGALVLVDAVQVPGQLPLDVTEWGADAVAAAGHKWLLGLWGSGFMYVDSDVADRFHPRSVGYRSVTEPTGDGFEFAAGAQRFEVSTTNTAPNAALREAIGIIDTIGIDRITQRVKQLATQLADSVPEKRLYSPKSPESGLVTIDVDDPEATVARLAKENIIVRSLPEPNGIRASVHAVNTPSDIEALVDALRSEW